MTQENREAIDNETQRQREAEAHRRPFGQTEKVEIDGAEGTHHHLEKTKDRETVETSLRGTEDSAPDAHHTPGKDRSHDEPAP
jgi:hypothetical protein